MIRANHGRSSLGGAISSLPCPASCAAFSALTRSRKLRVVVWKMMIPSGLMAGRTAGSLRFTKRITVASGHGAISGVQIEVVSANEMPNNRSRALQHGAVHTATGRSATDPVKEPNVGQTVAESHGRIMPLAARCHRPRSAPSPMPRASRGRRCPQARPCSLAHWAAPMGTPLRNPMRQRCCAMDALQCARKRLATISHHRRIRHTVCSNRRGRLER